MGNCIGKRNYKNFIIFLIFTNILAFYIIIVSICMIGINYNNISGNEDIYHIDYSANKTSNKISLAFSSFMVVSAFVFTVSLFGKLLVQHFILIIKDLTYYEDLRSKYKALPWKWSPFSLEKSVFWKCSQKMCSNALPPSLMIFEDRNENRFIDAFGFEEESSSSRVEGKVKSGKEIETDPICNK
jgi:hypothetical protein